MASQGPLGCNDNWIADHSVGSHDWISVDGGMSAIDGNTISALANGGTWLVKTNNHGFTIPSNATITGIKTEWYAKDSCLLSGTTVTLPDGSKASIDCIEVGDKLMGFNPDRSACVVTVTSVSKLPANSYYRIRTTKTGGKLQKKMWGDTLDYCEVKATGTHPFLNENNDFTLVSDLKVGDKIYTGYCKFNHDTDQMMLMSELEEITEIEVTNDSVYVYDISVDGPHVFLGNGFLVHNKTGGNISDNHSLVVKADGSYANFDLPAGDPLPTSLIWLIYGGDGEMWGESWTYSDINSASFGAAISFAGTSNSAVLDYMQITVYYTTPSGKKLDAVSVSKLDGSNFSKLDGV